MAEQRLVAQVDRVRDVRISGKVERRRGMNPRKLVEITISVPGGDITKLGALLDLDSDKEAVKILFFTEEIQAEMHLEPVHFTSEMTEKDGTQEWVVTFKDGDKSWTGKGATLRLATIESWKQFEVHPTEVPSFLTDAEKARLTDIMEGTSEKAFEEMGHGDAIKGAIAYEQAAVAPETKTEVKTPKRSRRKKVEPPAGADNHNGAAENIGPAAGQAATTEAATV